MTMRHGIVLVAGSANADFVVRAPRIPAPGETVLGEDLAIIPGGKGANQAVACARAGGGATRMLVARGDDTLAPMIEASLQAAGVALDVVRADRPTGAALITVSHDGENAITVAPGANARLHPGGTRRGGEGHHRVERRFQLHQQMADPVQRRQVAGLEPRIGPGRVGVCFFPVMRHGDQRRAGWAVGAYHVEGHTSRL